MLEPVFPDTPLTSLPHATYRTVWNCDQDSRSMRSPNLNHHSQTEFEVEFGHSLFDSPVLENTIFRCLIQRPVS